MRNLLKPRPTMQGKITFDIHAAGKLILEDESIFYFNSHSNTPAGIFVIGVWNKEDELSLSKQQLMEDGTSKMIFFPWHKIRGVVHDIERSTSTDKPSPTG